MRGYRKGNEVNALAEQDSNEEESVWSRGSTYV